MVGRMKKLGRPKGTSFPGGVLQSQMTAQQAAKKSAIYAEWVDVFGYRPTDSQVLRDGLDRQLSEMARILRMERNKQKGSDDGEQP